jgi:hypothetical protein
MTVAVAFSAATLACANEEPESSSTSEELTTEHVTFGEQLGQVRGHFLAGRDLYEAGDEEGATTHTGHPVAELLTVLETDVRDADEEVADDLGPALRKVAQVVADDGSVEDLEGAMTEAGAVLDRAEAAVAGDNLTTPKYRASVISALLATVNAEYGEAVQDGKVELLVEYQDAWAFTQVAKAAYQLIETDVREASEEEADEIDEAFETLDDALPAIEPPDEPAPGDDVERATTLVGAELEETVDALVVETVSPEESFDNIESLLDQVLEAYEAGNAEEASEFAVEAYLENYELVEAQVIELAPEVNEELEPLLQREIRDAIDDEVELSELRTMIDRARELLAEAREHVTAEEH